MKFHSTSIEAQINLKLELNLHTKKSIFDYKPQQIGNYIEHKIQQQLHYSGTFSYFHFYKNKYFIGTAEGLLFINNTPLQLQSPKTQNGLFSNLLYTLIPFKSTISQPNRKSFLYNIVDVSYKRQPTYQEKLNLKVVSVTLTNDEELLMVSLQLGEIHIFSYPSLMLLNVIELWSPQKYLYFYYEPSHKGVINILQSQLHESYEFICADQYGTVHKLCLDYYKFIKKKTLTYKHFLLLERGQAQYVPKWWEQAQLEFEVEVYQDKQRIQLIFDFQQLQNTKFIILWWNRIEILEISQGKKDKTIMYEILHSFYLLELDKFYEKFNQSSKDEKININQDYSSIFIQNNTIGFNKGPTIYLTDQQLMPQRFGILSYPLSLLDDSILPSIIYVKFIDQSILLIIYSNNDAFLFRIDKFGLNYEYANQLKKFNLDYSQMLSYTVNGLKINDFKESNFKYFPLRQDKFIYLDNKNKVLYNQLQYWKAYISQFNNNKRYLDGIAECYQIITMNNPYLNSLPSKKDILQKEISLLIEELVQNFINSIHNTENCIEEIILLIEFLLCSNNERILFLEIRELLIKCNKLSMLYEIIENIKINQIPSELIPQIMKEVSKQQQFDILSQLDPLKIDKEIISQVCLEKGYLELLIYFCNQNSDYISPLIKLIGYKEYYVQYILMILSGQGIQGERLITIEHWIGVKQILENILFNNNLVQILKYDIKLLIGIQLFQQNCAQIIIQQQNSLQINLDEDKIERYSKVLENNNSNVMSKIFLIIYLTYLELLEQEELEFKFEYLAYFVSQAIFSKLISFKRSEHFKLIKYYLDQFNIINIIDKNQFYLNHLIIYFNNQRLQLLEIEQCIVLLNQNIKNNSLIYCYLLNQQGQYIECFLQWIQIKIKQLQLLIFEWLENIFKLKLERQLQYSFILNSTKYLIQIDSKQTFKIINKYFNYLQIQLINDIGESENQLNGFVDYMQQILEQNIFLKDEIKIKYITYLCKNEPKQVKQILIKYHFPLKQCLNICQQYQNISSCLLINMMMGDYKSVILIISTKLVQKIKICIKGILKFKQLDIIDRQKVIKQLNKIKYVCSQQQQEYQLTDNLYLICLDRFFKDNPLKNLTHSSLPQLIKDQLLLVVVSLLYNMLIQMNFYDFAQIITIKYKDMPVSIFSKILANINDIRHQQREFYHQGQLIIDNTKYQLLQQLYNQYNQGYCITQKSCKCSFNDQFLVVYPCNHSFHLCCLSNNKAYCPLCYNYLNFKIMKYPIKKISLNQQQQIKDRKLILSQRIDKIKQFEHFRLQQQHQYLNNLKLL